MRDRFGIILLDMQVISRKQLMEALQNQQGKMKGKKIGAILLRCGYIARHHIKDALRVQKPNLSEEELELEVYGDKEESARIQAMYCPTPADVPTKDGKTKEFDLIVKIVLDSTGDIQSIFKQVAEKYNAFFDSLTKPILHADISSSDEAAQKKYRSDMDRYEAAEKLAAEFKKYLEAL